MNVGVHFFLELPDHESMHRKRKKGEYSNVHLVDLFE